MRTSGYPIMDMDERLKAMGQTLEIIADMRRKNERRLGEVTHNLEIVLDSIKRLETIATSHGERSRGLGGH
jgi:hypothetical protein